jgi:hypothetical protein
MDKCPVCKASVKPENMNRHLNKVHPEWYPESEEKSPFNQKTHIRVMYRCKQCHRLYGEATTSRHMKEAHALSTRSISDHHKYFFERVELGVKNATRNKAPATSTDKKELATLRKDSEAFNSIKGRMWQKQVLTVRCSICESEINYRNASGHYRKVHNWDLKGSKKNAEEKPAVMEERQSSSEWFNRHKVFNAGAYGLGKNGRH